MKYANLVLYWIMLDIYVNSKSTDLPYAKSSERSNSNTYPEEA